MITASSRQRTVALVCYFVAAFLFMGFLMPAGDGVLAFFAACCYVPLSVVAVIGAFRFPLPYCTVLKAVGLAGMGALLPVLVFCGPIVFTHIIRNASIRCS